MLVPHTYKTKLKLDKEVGGGGGSARERENRTRELEEPVSGPSRRPALEAPQPQTGGGSARERENVSRANVSGCLWIALDFVGSG